MLTSRPVARPLHFRNMRSSRHGRWFRVFVVVSMALSAFVVTSLRSDGSSVEAAPDDIIAFVLEGTGNGHGRGMSQWGAYGWAVDHGWDWQQILDHYFGGTISATTAADQRIDVRLTGYDGLADVGVISQSGGVQWNGLTAPAMRAQEAQPGVFAIFGADAAGCPSTVGVTWTYLGTHTQSVGDPVRFTTGSGDDPAAAPGNVLGVCASDGSVNHYRGALEVVDTSSGNRVVNDVAADQYVRGVIPKEIAASWAYAGNGAGVNAVRAQAVAARSYGLTQNRAYTYDGSATRYATTCDTPSCQVYGGSATRASAAAPVTNVEHVATDAAVVDTANVVRAWPAGSARAGQIVSTEFSASNGPRTAGGQFPAVDDPGDATANNPYHRWTQIIDADTFATQNGLGRITDVSMQSTTSSQYQGFDGIWFDDLVVSGTAGTYRKQAWDVKSALGLRSPGFTVRAIRRDATNKSMGFVGDSVGNGVTASNGALVRVTDGTFTSQTIDAFDSRCTTKDVCPGTSGVEAANALPPGLDLVVVELGYNDNSATFASDIDAMMAALIARGTRQVAWVNLADIRQSNGSSTYGPSNAALSAAQSRWGNMTVLDWNAASNTPERSRWFSDGVHLTTTGSAQFALWLRDRLLELSPTHYLAPPKRIELPVVGASLTSPEGAPLTVPPEATGVSLNVTMVRPASGGYATVWPCQADRPEVSSLNALEGEVVANNVIAPVSDAGTVCFYSSVGTNFVVDIAGWFVGPQAAGAVEPFVGLLPDRRVDTRIGLGGRSAKVGPSSPLTVPVAGIGARLPDGTATTVPANVAAVALNVTVAQSSGSGFATVWPCGTSRPFASNVNFSTNTPTGNGVVAPVGADGSVCIHTSVDAHVIVDVAGYFGGIGPAAAAVAPFTAVTPARLVDTRIGLGTGAAPIQPGGPLRVQVRGVALGAATDPEATVVVPDDASAVALNLTVVRPSASGYATVWPCGSERPQASNLNFVAGRNRANSVIAPIGADGTVCVYVEHASHVLVDVSGWFRGGVDASFVGAVPTRLVDTRIAVGPAPT